MQAVCVITVSAGDARDICPWCCAPRAAAAAAFLAAAAHPFSMEQQCQLLAAAPGLPSPKLNSELPKTRQHPLCWLLSNNMSVY